MDHVLSVPQGDFPLERLHHDPNEPLRAWDAADEYVLEHLADLEVPGDRWLIVNDAFGALATALAGRDPVSWSDSTVAMAAAAANLERNGTDVATDRFVPSTETPTGPFDVVVIKVPRTLAHLDDQLRTLRGQLHEGSIVVGAGMTKHVHTSTIAAFEAIIGPTPTSRAQKKARLLFSEFDPSLSPTASPFPIRWTTPDGLAVTGHPNVFSTGSLDDGTRMLVAHLPDLARDATVIDLGCGNGIVGAAIALAYPAADIICCDESYQAVAAAEATVGPHTDRATFVVTDVLDSIEDASADAVLLNPPFHVGGARTSAVAHRMFAESRRVLRPDGELRIVANRHLKYFTILRRWFDEVEVVHSDPRYVVLSARKPRAEL